MRRRSLQCSLVLLAALGSAACGARVGGTVPPGIPSPVVLQTGEGAQLLMLSHEPGMGSQLVSASADRAFVALVAVFQELQLPITGLDTVKLIVATQRTVVKQIGGKPVDGFFDCQGAYENYASSGRVTVDVRSQALPADSGHTEVRTTISAVAQPRNGGAAVPCPTNGQLHRLIHARLGQRIRVAAP